jgi:Uma2 family endonuclease
MTNVLLKEEQGWTYKDYKAWELNPGERYEVIYGDAYAMAAPTTIHQAILGGLFARLHNFLDGKRCRVFPAPYDVRLFYERNESDDTVVQPDIVVICDKRKIGPEGGRGAPDVVIEIWSPSNSSAERSRKFNLYRDAGVREYWEVFPNDKMMLITTFEGGQNITHIYREKDSAVTDILPGLVIPMEAVFAE